MPPTLSTPQTFEAVLSARLRTDPGQPLVTFYDHDTGDRVELSVTTYANWVAKVAGLLSDLDLEIGDRLGIDLPTNWLTPVFLGAAWTLGLTVITQDQLSQEFDAVVCDPSRAAHYGQLLDARPDLRVLVSSLHPLARPCESPVPSGAVDFGVEVWSQPDAFVAFDPPTGQTEALSGLTQADLLEKAVTGTLSGPGDRLLTVANPASPPGLTAFLEPLVKGGSLVLVAHPDPDRLASTYAVERATRGL